MGQWKSTLTKTASIPATVKPKRSWGKYFGAETGFSLNFPQGNSISAFFDRRLKLGDSQQLSTYLGKDQIVAHCLSCLGEDWEVHSESTGPGESGIVVYTSKGKAIAAGTAKVLKNGTVRFSVATLYNGMTDHGTIEFKAKATGNSDGSWSIIGLFGASRD